MRTNITALAACSLLGLPLEASPASQAVRSTATSPYDQFESGAVRLMACSPDGHELYVLNTPDHRIEAYHVTTAQDIGPVGAGGATGTRIPLVRHRRSIFTGLEPVAIQLDPSDPTRAFVANHLSDTVSVVDLDRGAVVHTIEVGDEPRDLEIVDGKLFVACSRAQDAVLASNWQDHTVVVHSAAAPYDRLATISIDGHRPRALTSDGEHVYVVPLNSGNHTTVLKDDLAEQLGITQLTLDLFDDGLVFNPLLLLSYGAFAERGWNIPQAGRIVFDWEYPTLVQQLPDRDISAIRVDTLALENAYTTDVGTTLFDIERNPATGDLWVVGTDAHNRIRIESRLRGAAVDNFVSTVEPGPGGAILRRDLLEPPFTQARHAQPHDIAFYQGPARAYAHIASLGTASIVVLDAQSGGYVRTIETGALPTGMVVDEVGRWLHVFSREDGTIESFDIARQHAPAGRAVRLPYDPEPELVRRGRRVMYDASPTHGAGNGAMSCATCHVFADTDALAWDLGESTGGLSYIYPPLLGDPQMGFSGRVVARRQTPIQSPMKGPLATQTLRGMKDGAPFHWRGDRAFLHNFQPAFVGLQDGDGIADADMQALATFLDSIAFPPNPYQREDRRFVGSADAGKDLFGIGDGPGAEYQSGAPGFTCASCHTADFEAGTDFDGSHPFIDEELIFQVFNTGQFRGIYDKEYREVTGFGTHHDGAFDGSLGFLNHDFQGFPSNDLLSGQERADMAQFLLEWDTGISPLVGAQFTLDTASAAQAASYLNEAERQSRAGVAWIDLIGKGSTAMASGAIERFGLRYAFDDGAGAYRWQRDDGSWAARADLVQLVQSSDTSITFTAVPRGLGQRLGVDRDEDGLMDGAERLARTSPVRPDSDRDGYTDAREVALGSDPRRYDSHLADDDAPSILEANVSRIFVSTATLQVIADEPVTVAVDVTALGSSAAAADSPGLAMRHQMVLGSLPAGQPCEAHITVTDRNGNATDTTVLFNTVVTHLHVDSIEWTQIQSAPALLRARVRVVDRSNAPRANVPLRLRFAGNVGGNVGVIDVTTGPNGVAEIVTNPFTPSGSELATVGVEFIGSLAQSSPWFVGRGGSQPSFFYEQPANRANYRSIAVQ